MDFRFYCEKVLIERLEKQKIRLPLFSDEREFVNQKIKGIELTIKLYEILKEGEEK